MTFQELYDYLYDSASPINPRLFIDTYEQHYVLISNVDLSNLADYDSAMRMTCDYAMALENMGYLQKGIQYLDKAIDLMENFPDYQREKLFENRYYELLKFHKARALYNLKKYKESFLIFSELDKAFPDNDQYLSWIYGIKNRSLNQLSWIATGIMIFILFLRTMFSDQSPMFDYLSFWVLLFSFVFFIACIIMRGIRKIKQKRIKTPIN